MYLSILAKTIDVPDFAISIYGFAALWLAYKLEHSELNPELHLAKINLENELGESINGIEDQLFRDILKWKLNFCPPCEFIHSIIDEMRRKNLICELRRPLMIKLAIEFVELIFICIFNIS